MRVSWVGSGVLCEMCDEEMRVMIGEWTVMRLGKTGYSSCESGVGVKEGFEGAWSSFLYR